MTEVERRFGPNTARIVEETIEDETLIIDMVTGAYHSCLGSSSAAWRALRQGATVSDTAALLSSTYGVAASDAQRDVDEFVTTLVAEQLLVPLNGASGTVGAGESVAPSSPDTGYQRLRLETYTDLADLILLDPIHDVMEVGWPAQGE